MQVWRAQFSRSASGQNMSLTFCCVGANFQNFKFCIFHLDFLDFPLSLFVFSALLFSIVHLSSMYPFSFCVFHFSTLTLCVFRYFLYFPVQLLVFPTLNFCIIHFHYFCFLVWVSVFSTFTFCIFRFEILYFVRKYCLGASPSHLLQWSSWKPLLPSELCGWVPICRPRGFPQDNLENIILPLIQPVLHCSIDTFLEGEKRGWVTTWHVWQYNRCLYYNQGLYFHWVLASWPLAETSKIVINHRWHFDDRYYLLKK